MKEKWLTIESEDLARFSTLMIKVPKIDIKAKEIYSEKSPFQKIEIFDTETYGRILLLDGLLQLSQRDEFIYHEMLVHPAMISHPNPKKVLIIGGGDGGALREVLKHPIEKVFLCEIDKKVIEVCKRYLSFVSKKSFNSKKARIFIDDGLKFIKKYHDFFDVIIIDATDPRPRDMAIGLFSEKFYRDAFSALTSDGIIVSQSGWFFEPFSKQTRKNLRKVFPYLKIFRAYVPCFPCFEHTFTLGSKKIDLEKINLSYLRRRFKKIKGNLKYYSPEIHLASGVLPKYIKERL